MKLNITLDGRRLYRSTTNAWLFGVCGGIAQHFGWKPMLVRLVTVIVGIAAPGITTFAVITLYLALGLLLPSGDQP